MRSGKTLRWCGALALALLSSQPAEAVFHLMQIEQVIGGVCGDVSSQAIQLRMRTGFQNVVTLARLVAYDAQGLNPIEVIDFTSNVAMAASGDRILITTPQFSFAHGPSPDFTMTNPIPASYLAAGRLTFEADLGIIYWSLAWGGTTYTGLNDGSTVNDPDGDFGPPFDGPLPSSTSQALLFTGPAGALSSSNANDYELTPGDAIFTNNGGASGAVMSDCIFADGFESGSISAWSGSRGGALEVLSGAAFSGNFGLQVTAGLTCSSDDLTVTSPPMISGDFAGCNSVTASSVQVVSPGATFRAGTFIALDEAFSVASGADFTAVIDPFLLSPFVLDDSPIAETTYNAIFHLRLDALSLAVGDELEHFVGYSSNGDPQLRVVLRKNPTLLENRLAILAREDGGSFVEHSSEFLLPMGYNWIEIAWRAGAGNGEFLVSINSAPLSGLTDLNNGGSQIDFVRWGVVDGTVLSTTGTMELDEFRSFR